MKEKKNEDMLNATVFKNGPLVIKGSFEMTGVDGEVEIKEKSTAFCRCGGSKNKPYCDGMHKSIDFIG